MAYSKGLSRERFEPFGRALAALLLAVWSCSVFAHKASDAYLDLRIESGAVALRWDIALRDLDQVLDLDGNGDGSLEWGEVQQRQAAIKDYALRSIDVATAAGPCRPTSVVQALARRGDGAYAVLRWRAECPQLPSTVSITYRFLQGIDPTHRAIVSVPGATVALRTLRPSSEPQQVNLEPARGTERSYDLAGFFVEGFQHILHGVDHLAFLLALLIPAIAVAAFSAQRLAPTLRELVTVISVFTLAHSITLGLTALDLIRLPSNLVESLVALSVAVAGWQALRVCRLAGRPGGVVTLRADGGVATLPTWLVFSFGLVHGIGFGSALGDAGFGGRLALSALFGFNVGVEAGQLLVVAYIFPLAWALRGTRGFKRFMLPVGAAAIVLAGVAWFVLRVFGVDIIGRLTAI